MSHFPATGLGEVSAVLNSHRDELTNLAALNSLAKAHTLSFPHVKSLSIPSCTERTAGNEKV